MAILCIRLKDNMRPNHPAPHKAARRGDIVSILPDNQHPGRKIAESPNWLLIRLKGVPANRLQFLVKPRHTDVDDPDTDKAIEIAEEKDADDLTPPVHVEVKPIAFRRFKFDVTSLNQQQLRKGRTGMLVYDTTDDDFDLRDFLDQCIDRVSNRTLRQDGRSLNANRSRI